MCPQRLISALAYRLMRIETPAIKNALIRWFAHRYAVDMRDADPRDPTRYACFNAFFTRALHAGARTLPDDAHAIACPVDGSVSEIGGIAGERLIQAKGHTYSLAALLAHDGQWVARFRDGKFATLYLSPRDYHRVHMPIDARLLEMVHVPGRLFSVNRATTRALPDLFARNERVICYFQSGVGPLCLVLVGALCVSGIETAWHGLVTPPRGKRVQRWTYEEAHALALARGQEMGRFNMGSTVIVLLPPRAAAWQDGIQAGQPVVMGQPLGETLADAVGR